MTNPYQSPNSSRGDIGTSPLWYAWFCKVYWPAWWIGTAFIALSWFGVVTPTLGWIGFGLAGLAALGSYVLPSLAGIKSDDCVVLDSRLLKVKGDTYYNVMKRFRDGASLMYDGVAFGFRPNNEIACAVAANSETLDDSAAAEIAGHAQSVFDQLVSESVEFAAAVAGQRFRISIISSFDANARELCRVIDGKLDWKC